MSRKQLALAHGAIVLSLVYTVGCGQGPARIQAPGINASSAGRQAMQEYDTNGDGVVSGDELDSAPSLKAALSTLDTNSDGGVSADEVAERVKAWQAERTGLATITCLVTMNDQPVPNAEVTFEPEEFLGSNIQAAVGTTNRFGQVSPIIPKENRPTPETPPGMALGLYVVRVSKITGSETIPARYNVDSVLGQQVSPDEPTIVNNSLKIELKSE